MAASLTQSFEEMLINPNSELNSGILLVLNKKLPSEISKKIIHYKVELDTAKQIKILKRTLRYFAGYIVGLEKAAISATWLRNYEWDIPDFIENISEYPQYFNEPWFRKYLNYIFKEMPKNIYYIFDGNKNSVSLDIRDSIYINIVSKLEEFNQKINYVDDLNKELWFKKLKQLVF